MSWKKRATGHSRVDLPNDSAYVYVAWGLDDRRPLYVGKTRRFHRRMAMHERHSKWWPLVRRFDLYSYRTEADALVAESEAIRDLGPDYNLVGNQGKLTSLARYLKRRISQPPTTYGPEISTDEIPADQLAIVARVQRRKPAA